MVTAVTTTPPATGVSHGGSLTRAATTQPWAVALYFDPTPGYPSSAARFLCSGTLVSQQVVVTAAHCVRGFTTGDLWVQVGANVLGRGRRIAVDGAWWNPKYTPRYLANDVAVLHLLLPAQVAQLAVLASSPRSGNGISYLYGWGADERGRLSTALRTARLVNLDPAGRNEYGRTFTVSTMILAGRWIPALHRFAGACPGDSGGPLVQYAGTRPILVGVVSFGSVRCDRAPTVFTRVSAFRTLILAGIASATRQAAKASLATPVNLSLPTITGDPVVGQTLTCTKGTWTPNATRFIVEWKTRTEIRHEWTLTVTRDMTGAPIACEVMAYGRRASISAFAAPITPPALPAALTWVDDSGPGVLHGLAEPSTATPAIGLHVVSWCVVLDGLPLNRSLATGPTIPANNSLSTAMFDPSTGCYSSPYYVDLRDGYLALDTLLAGAHTISVTITDVNGATATAEHSFSL